MKKLFTLVLLAGLLFVTPASAQGVKFGLKGGLNITDLHLSDVSDNFDKDNRAGWFIGPTVKFTLPLVGLSFDASALYDYKSNKLKNTDDLTEETESRTVKQQSINIPINVRYGFGLSSVADIFLFAGPQWSFNIGDRHFSWETATTGSTYSLRSTNFSVNVGLGVTALSHLQVTANYNIVCGKTAELTVLDAAGNIYRGKGRNNSWQVAVAYYF